MKMKVSCGNTDCFGNVCTRCSILSDYPSQPCPFYKTEQELEQGRLEAHKKLQGKGLYRLIDYYEYNKERKW